MRVRRDHRLSQRMILRGLGNGSMICSTFLADIIALLPAFDLAIVHIRGAVFDPIGAGANNKHVPKMKWLGVRDQLHDLTLSYDDG